jgi:hypothetical protein
MRPWACELAPPNKSLERTREAYDHCIAEFKAHVEKRESFSLGIMGTGFIELPNKPGEYQSNALAVLEEYHGDRVCYSFAMPV